MQGARPCINKKVENESKCMKQNEGELIRDAQQGNTAAFNTLIRQHDRRIFAMVCSIVGDRHEAQDIYQETFLRAFEKIHTFRAEGEFAGWLARIAVNQAISRLRQKRLRRWLPFDAKGRPEENGEAIWVRARSEDTPDRDYLNKELRVQIELALQELPERQRVAFVLKHIHGYKISEISATMGWAEGTVKNALFRATRKLQRALRMYKSID